MEKKFRKEDIFALGKPIKGTIDVTKWIIHSFKRCIWHRTAGNLFLVKGEDYDEFIFIFTTLLDSKPETIIGRYKDRSSIEQTNKELKYYLNIERHILPKKRVIMGIFL